jgi:hypothetical protein
MAGVHVRGSYGDPIEMPKWGVQCFFWTLIVILVAAGDEAVCN